MAHVCEKCPLQAKYERNPRSLTGRLWRWHIDFCPGWKAYFISLGAAQKQLLREKYNFVKYGNAPGRKPGGTGKR